MRVATGVESGLAGARLARHAPPAALPRLPSARTRSRSLPGPSNEHSSTAGLEPGLDSQSHSTKTREFQIREVYEQIAQNMICCSASRMSLRDNISFLVAGMGESTCQHTPKYSPTRPRMGLLQSGPLPNFGLQPRIGPTPIPGRDAPGLPFDAFALFPALLRLFCCLRALVSACLGHSDTDNWMCFPA